MSNNHVSAQNGAILQPLRLLFVINPQAGKGDMRMMGIDCIDIFVRAGFEVTVYTTQCALQATEIIRTQAKNYDRIVCAGGDGTLNEAVSGLLQSDLGGRPVPPLGYIPSGTVNDFASSLAISKIPMEAALTAAIGKVQDVDIGKFDERFFTYVAAFGAFTDVSYTTPQQNKNVLGRAAYVLEGIKTLPQIQTYVMTITTEDRTVHGHFVFGMISNATSVAGIRRDVMDADIAMDDGLFEVVLIRVPDSPTDWQGALFELANPDQEWTVVQRFKAAHITVTSEQGVPWTLDGEYGGKRTHVQVDNLARVLPILVRPAP